MDDLSVDMFTSPTVKVGGYQEAKAEIEAACLVIFRRMLQPEEFAELISAPDQSELLVEARADDTSVELRLSHKWIDGTHDYLLYVDEGRRVIEFVNIVSDPQAPQGFETLLFAHQVESFRKFGLDEIRLYADGYAGHPGKIIGYYVWARFGFIMYLDGFGPQLAEAGFEHADTTLDLFNQEGGAEWWYNHGSAREAVFDLDENSACSVALRAYLDRKRVRADGESE